MCLSSTNGCLPNFDCTINVPQRKRAIWYNTFFHDSRIPLKTDLDEEVNNYRDMGKFPVGAKIQSIEALVCD